MESVPETPAPPETPAADVILTRSDVGVAVANGAVRLVACELVDDVRVVDDEALVVWAVTW
jgi:hypothetical protein